LFLIGLVDGQIRLGPLEFEQVLLAGQMQRAGLGQPALALLEDIGDVIAGEGAADKRVG